MKGEAKMNNAKIKKQGFVIHNGTRFDYEVDVNGYIGLYIGLGKSNDGQIRPLTEWDDAEKCVHDMLDGAGY